MAGPGALSEEEIETWALLMTGPRVLLYTTGSR